MFDSMRNYVYQRRRGLATVAGFFGGLYLAGRYVLERLEEIREQVVQDKTARENLKRRFQQNQQDCTYTVLALIPSLGDRILEEMDVEGVTFTLQMQSRAVKARLEGSIASDINTSSLTLNTEQPSVTSSMDLAMPRRDVEEQVTPSNPEESAQSWVDQFTSQSSPGGEELAHGVPQERGSPVSSSGAQLSDSIISADTSLISGSDGERSGVMVDSLHSIHSESGGSQAGAATESRTVTTQSKAELWREVKILTFTRTVTILYSITLLSILTHIQLNLLGRYKYVQSVLDMVREERLREKRAFESSIYSHFWTDLDHLDEELEIDDSSNPLGLFGSGRTGSTERKYLTLSWWLIHVGWREIGDRVRRAVENVFEGISLKAKLGVEDLERLFKDVRREIEFNSDPTSVEADAGPSLQGRRTSFLSSLIPSSDETLKDVLVQGGLPQQLTDIDDASFFQLVNETRAFISSADFGRVLEVCLDHGVESLFDGMRRTLFTDDTGRDQTLGGPKIRLAGLLPGIARWSHGAIHGTPNELVEGIADLRELAGFSAIIYSSYEGSFE